MITTAELDIMVKEEFKNDNTILKVWDKKKNCLGIHPEPEYADADKIIWVDTNGSMTIYEDELAVFLWKCGCSMGYTQDWVDGSPIYNIALPLTEEEYQTNVSEGTKNWNDVINDAQEENYED